MKMKSLFERVKAGEDWEHWSRPKLALLVLEMQIYRLQIFLRRGLLLIRRMLLWIDGY
jgi:hypothetical protein